MFCAQKNAALVVAFVLACPRFGFGQVMALPTSQVELDSPGEQIPTVLTLESLEQIALQRNPTLVQVATQIDISRAKALQAGLYPNPTIGYQGELIGAKNEAGRSTAGEFQGGFIQQEIVTAGKLRLSRAKYQQEARAAEIQAMAQQLRVVNGLHIAFYEVLTAQRLIENHGELVKNAEDAVKDHGGTGQRRPGQRAGFPPGPG